MTNYHSLDEKELLTLLKNGNKRAFAELYDRYWERMVVTAHIKLQSRQDAEEVVQELFVELWRRRAGLEINNSFYTYIAGAIKYKIYTFLAKKQKEDGRVLRIRADAECNTTQEWLDYRILKEDLEKAVLELPEKCRLVFQLSREKGMSNKEIAKSLQVSIKAIEKQLTKALSHLHTAIRNFTVMFFW